MGSITALQHIQFLRSETVKPMPKNCDGCGYTTALTYKATSIGIDTLFLNIVAASEDCAARSDQSSFFIIEVKNAQ